MSDCRHRFLRPFLLLLSLLMGGLLASCRKTDPIVPPQPIPVGPGSEITSVAGFYLLNEGNMGSNKCTLDWYDAASGIYTRNIYGKRNPGVVYELGDVGNDMGIYGSKLYVVVNCSHFVEVMEARTARHISQISIPNCRYVVFDKGYAYVSSYAGPVQIDPNARLGYVAKVDTTSLQVVAQCIVGYQPEEMVISDRKLYVANSGGYRVPNYDRTVSVIDLETFSVCQTIDVAINLHRMEMDKYGRLYVSSRGDYYTIPSNTYVVDTRTHRVTDSLGLACSDMCMCGDSLYIQSVEWNYNTGKNTVSYALYDTKKQALVTRNFITDGTETSIKIPYCLAVNPVTRDIYVGDAGNYVTPGKLYCYDNTGLLQWKVTTGDIPSRIVFSSHKLTDITQ